MSESVAGANAAPPAAPQAEPQRKLIRTAEIDLFVDDAEAASDRVSGLVRSLGGFVAETAIEKRRHRVGARLVVRVPEARFDDALTALKALGRDVARVHVTVEDVADRYVDLEARLRSLTLTEGELEKLLAESREQKRDATEIMAIYRQLTEIRTEREQVQGHRQALDDRIALATIRVALYLDEEALAATAPAWKPLDTVRSSFTSLVRLLKSLADAAIVFTIVLLPVLLLAGIAAWALIRLLLRTRRRRGRPA